MYFITKQKNNIQTQHTQYKFGGLYVKIIKSQSQVIKCLFFGLVGRASRQPKKSI